MTSSGPQHAVVFSTETPYVLPAQRYMLPAAWGRYQLSQLINTALALPRPVPFDFLIRGTLLRGTIAAWAAANSVGEEETLAIEYIESVLPPQPLAHVPHPDWVSSVCVRVPKLLLTAAYDGHIRAFDSAQAPIADAHAHTAPALALAHVSANDDAHVVASASHDLTARLTRLSPNATTPLASLHLHTAPLAAVAASADGAHVLTAGWDALIGLWDTSIPRTDEVPRAPAAKRRRVVQADNAVRKAPVAVLRSHVGRVSAALFSRDARTAYSAGFDATVRTWDIERELCTHTITAPEKPHLALALAVDGTTALAASTDRTLSAYDVRAPDARATATLTHPATPTSVVPAPAAAHLLASGARDGTVRVWDLRAAGGALAAFRARGAVLAVDWAGGVVGVGGEGGLEVWRVGEGAALAGTEAAG